VTARERARNAVAGRAAKSAGDSLESWAEHQHQIAQRLGILGPMEHNEPHARTIKGKTFYEAAGVADYTGTLVGGRTVAVEAKSTSDDKFYRTAVSPKQHRYLDDTEAAGGLSILLVEFRRFGERQRFAVAWGFAPWGRLRSADSISFADLADWRVLSPCYLSRWHSGGSPIPSLVREYPVE